MIAKTTIILYSKGFQAAIKYAKKKVHFNGYDTNWVVIEISPRWEKSPSQMVRVSRVSKWFIQISNGWTTLGAIILFLSFMVLVLPAQETNTDLGSENVGTPDLSFYY